MTLARAAREYHERVIEPSRTTIHAAHWIASLENHMPDEIWHAPIDSIQPPALLAALSKVRALEDSKTRVPETLARIRQRLDSDFEDAIFHGRCSSNPAAAIRRKMRETQVKRERGQFAALPYREAPAFITQLRGMPGTAARSLELAVLTAARTSEVLLATWSEFRVDDALWIVPGERMKGGEDHAVPLSATLADQGIVQPLTKTIGNFIKGTGGQGAGTNLIGLATGQSGGAAGATSSFTTLQTIGIDPTTLAFQRLQASMSAPTGTSTPDGSSSGGGLFGGFFDSIGKFFKGGSSGGVQGNDVGLAFESGGYTGAFGGIVHPKEYVFSAPAVAALGVWHLENMHRAARAGRVPGFSDGGYVGAALKWSGQQAPAQRPIELHIHQSFAAGTTQKTVDQAAGSAARRSPVTRHVDAHQLHARNLWAGELRVRDRALRWRDAAAHEDLRAAERGIISVRVALKVRES